MDISLILEIINVVLIIIVGLIVFNQRTIIQKMKSFMNIFDIDKLKKSTEYIIEGEQKKLFIEKEEKSKQFEKELQKKDDDILKLEEQLKTVKTRNKVADILKEKGAIQYSILAKYTAQILVLSIFQYIYLDVIHRIGKFNDSDNFLSQFNLKILNQQKILGSFDDNLSDTIKQIDVSTDDADVELKRLNKEIKQNGILVYQLEEELKEFGNNTGINQFLDVGIKFLESKEKK